MVLNFNPQSAKDSHGNFGPLHTLLYEDGEFDEVFDEATKFQIALPRAAAHVQRAVGRGVQGAAGAGASGGSTGGGSRRAAGGAETQSPRRDSAEPAGGSRTPDAKHAESKSTRERKLAPYRQRPPSPQRRSPRVCNLTPPRAQLARTR